MCKLLKSLLVVLALFACFGAMAEEKEMTYVNALDLRIINKGFDDSLTPYTRIPACLKDSVRPSLWERAQCSSGMAVR